jgi:dihydroorotase
MTAYLTDGSDAADILAGFRDGVLTAVKLYPAHATTNSQFGVTAIAAVSGVLAAMEKAGMPLLVHGEVTRAEVDVFDREARFVEEVLVGVLRDFPGLKIVLEHVTTAEGVAIVRENASRMAGTMTPQHLLFDRNEIFRGGIRPHMYCLPILKRSTHKQALRQAATSGEACFFLGTDTAPHLRHLKETACGCAGVFSAPTAIEAYLKVFAEENALDRFEAFASLNGPAFYGLAPNEERVTWVEAPRLVAEAVEVEGQGEIVTLFGGETVGWSPAAA